MKFKAWISALRLRTLPLSISGILVGSFSAYFYVNEKWNVLVFVFCIITTLLFQILSNLANDLGDGMKGTDNANRLGPMRAVQSGEISQKEMKIAVTMVSILSAVSAAYLIYIGTQEMPVEVLYFYAALAVLCIVAAITYTVGKKAYGYNGFGDVFVFLFFGLVSVLGSFTLFTKNVDYGMILPATTIGLLSTAVLNLNNMRDRLNDKASNKNTLVVKMGPTLAKLYHAFLILGGLVSWLLYVSSFNKPLYFISALPFLVLILHLRKVLQTKDERAYDPELKKVALSTFFISLLWLILIVYTV